MINLFSFAIPNFLNFPVLHTFHWLWLELLWAFKHLRPTLQRIQSASSSKHSKASHLKGFILLQHSKRPSACPTNPKNRKTKNHKKLKKISTIRFQHLSTKTIPRRLNQNVGFLKQISSLGSSEAQGLRAGLSSPNDFCNGNALGSCGTWPKGLIHCVQTMLHCYLANYDQHDSCGFESPVVLHHSLCQWSFTPFF